MAGGAAAFELQGNEVFPHRIKSLAAHEIGSALHHTAHAGLDRGVFLIEFVAVERQAGFHAQRVTGAETGGLHARIAEQGFPEINGVFGVNVELVAELAGIARTADQQLLAIPFRLAEGEVPEIAQVLTEQLFENVHGKRALKVNLGDFIGFVHDGDAGGQTFCYGLEITINAGGVDNDKEGVAHIINDAVVKDAALLVKDEAVAAAAFLECLEAVAHGLHEGLFGACSGNEELAHVTDIKNRRHGACMFVFGQNALILDGHIPARKGSHFRAVAFMPCAERRFKHVRHVFSFFGLPACSGDGRFGAPGGPRPY